MSVARPLLSVRDLRVEFDTGVGTVRAVDGVSFDVEAGGALGIVGESGSGKTVTALTVIGLARAPGAHVSGQVLVDGRDVLGASAADLRRLRGGDVAMIFQDPLSSLHPLKRVGAQVAEAVTAHSDLRRRAARSRALDLLGQVELPDPERAARSWPHELSGGMRQRAMIAMALAGGPRLLLADEPTSALDVTIQAQILDLLARLRTELGTALVLITHDLGVVARAVDDVAVMQGGRLVERAPAATIFAAPEHPETRRLLDATPRIDAAPAADGAAERTGEPLVAVRELAKRYGDVRAVDGVSFDVRAGETLALVGESGSGKSTLARLMTRLLEPTSGSVAFRGRDLAGLGRRDLKALRREVQVVFQDPYGALNPRKPVGASLAEPFAVHGLRPGRDERRRAVHDLLERVGLSAEHHDRYPHELSGGQRQRVGIARAIALGPALIVADEPVSALDLPIQAQILGLLRELQHDLGLTLVLIAHDLAVVRSMADRVAVMREGQVVELGDAAAIYAHPQHEYTRALLSAAPHVPSPR